MTKKIEINFGGKKKAKKNMKKGLALGVAAGTAIGAAAGVLFAPKPGKDTREDIKNGVTEGAKKVSEGVKSAVSSAEEGIKTVASKAQEGAKTLYRKSCCKTKDENVCKEGASEAAASHETEEEK